MKKCDGREIWQATEAEEQTALFEWAAVQRGKYPEIDLLHHIPNGGYRAKHEAAKLKAMGVKAGVPDLFLPVARGECHGLYIELKRMADGRPSGEQIDWMTALAAQGYQVALCRGWDAAAREIMRYLGMRESYKARGGEEKAIT